MSRATFNALHTCDVVARALKGTGNTHAVLYLTAARRAYDEYGPRGVRAQILYAISNLRSWRGDVARASKVALARCAQSLEIESHESDAAAISGNSQGSHAVYYT